MLTAPSLSTRSSSSPASPQKETDKELVSWAKRASVNAIRDRADLASRPPLQESERVQRNRGLWWDFDLERTAVLLDALLPVDDGLKVVGAIEKLAATLPAEPEPEQGFAQRCADALVVLTSGAAPAAGGSQERRQDLLVSVDLGVLGGDGDGVRIDGGPVLHPEVARRLSCDCRLQAVLKDPQARALGIGRRSRSVPSWLMRQLLERDRGCTFPGCHTRRFISAHHILHWSRGGPTDLSNLVVVCSFHHKLVHEGGWKVLLEDGLTAVWLRPNGERYEPGPSRRRAPPRAA